MSFTPLPETLIADLRAVGDRPVLDLGCGDGRLTARLRAVGARVWGLDSGRGLGRRMDVVADVAAPPFRPGAIALAVAGNLVRHLPSPDGLLAAWGEAAASDGILWILEDEPARDGEPGALYRDLQAFLARVAPDRRRPLTTADAFRATLRDERGWTFGSGRNDELPADLEPLLAWLDASAAAGADEAARLGRGIRAGGLSYGRCWWARLAPEEAR